MLLSSEKRQSQYSVGPVKMANGYVFGVTLLVLLSAAVESIPFQQSAPRRTLPEVRDVEDGRLARRIVPRHYNLELQPDIYSTQAPPFRFTGTVEIYVTCLLTADHVVLNAKDLDYTSLSIVVDPNTPVPSPSPLLLQWSYDPVAQFLALDVVNPFVPQAWYIIRIQFSGWLRSENYGLYWDSYIDTDGSTKYLVATQMESIEARTAFPSFDEPDLKATFNITVVSKPPSVTLSNMPVIRTEDRANGWVAYYFATSPIMSTYQVCIAVGDFVAVEALWQNVTTYPIHIYARRQMAEKLEFAARAAPLIQAWLEQETGIPYTLPKMDHIALPSKTGAMENWGLITYGEYLLCVDRETSAASGIFDVASLISHELAHQWYGNLVTMKWWNDIWLNEGFATFYNYYPHAALGWEDSEAQQIDRRRGVQQFFEIDQWNSSDPIRKFVDNVWQADAAFSGSTYPKGGAVLRMLKSILSFPTFKRGVTNYLTKYSYSSADTDELWAELTAQAAADGVLHPDGSALDVKQIMDAWLNQMGYPVLTVTRNGDGTATVTSRRYLNPRGQSPDVPSNYSYSWHIPITVATRDNANGDTRPSVYIPFGESTTTISGVPTTPGDWFIINVKQDSFYRVDYDSILRQDIVNQLIADHTVIPAESRSQLIDDSFTLSRSLNLPIAFAMDTTLYLSNERTFNPWSSALKHLLYLDSLIFDELWDSTYRNYVVGQLKPVYTALGWNYETNESPLKQFLRRDVISNLCASGDPDCRQIASQQYASYIANPDVNSVNANNLPTVLCVGVSQGTASDWSIAFDQYQKRKATSIREERFAYLFAMACSSDSVWHDRLLSYIIGGSLINTRDANQALLYMTQSRTGRPVVWNYLINSWNQIPSFINKVSVLRSIASTFSDISRSTEFNNFIGYYPPTSQSQLISFREIDLTINQNIDWRAANSDSLLEWLNAHLPPASRQNSLSESLPISPIVHWNSLEAN